MQTSGHFGRRLPLDFCGDFFRRLAPMVTSSVRMAIEGSSSPVGAPPAWLRRAADVRVLGWTETDACATVLQVEAPPLGEAAEEIYKQTAFWDTKPEPQETALNIFARVAKEVRSGNLDSSLYDLGLLKRFGNANRLFGQQVEFVDLPERWTPDSPLARLDRDVAVRAQQLTEQTPASRQVRVSGRLDMMRHSTRSFEMILEDGRPVRGVLENAEEIDRLKPLLGKFITVVGKAVYRPSGSVLRIDAQGMEEGTAESRLFTRIPPPILHRVPSSRIRTGDQNRNWMDAFFGTWPGDETDEELLEMLREVRG
ncbi:hypothetical protein H7849_21340 [Alloacidobacterium dinghuense]|uniref:Uncharacterized protein n=1 Tax=Alloacidobacterium dinghuense TaxID=2763107 RepID=A0A7G8BGB6_9BACT|nr:hypothetical protein [Alloacidobacterium dinghuense]QNI31586.1 hypothetical protein H7849_21340 [Alloacidobacterium dinghuense]